MKVLLITCGLVLFAVVPTRAEDSQIVGCWNVQSLTVDKAGAKSEPFGHTPVGQMIFTADSRFSSIMMRPDLPFDYKTSTDRFVTTIMATFGTYTLQHDTLTMKIEAGSSRPDWRQKTLRRNVVKVSPTELTYFAQAAEDTNVHVLAKRC